MMSAKRRGRLDAAGALIPGPFPTHPIYVYAGLDDAPLILDFEQQLAQQREAEETLRQIAALVDFQLACLLHGADPRPAGRG